MRVRAPWPWLLLPLFELLAHALIRARVPSDDELARAAARIRRELAPQDLVVAAPAWADPLLRQHLGDAMSFAMVGPSDRAGFTRLWVLSLRGALPRELPARAPELDQRVGRVRVLRYALGPSPVRFDFVQALPSARASVVTHGQERPCAWRIGGSPRGGGLGKGVLFPLVQRFECDPARPFLSQGRVVMEDLSITPRDCIWQHPQGREPVALTWDDVPLGDELVLYGGLYYEHERMREHGPVEARVLIDGAARGTLRHRDGDGWKRLRIATAGRGAGARGQVRIETTAPNPHLRSFCWSATTRRAPATEAR